MGLSSPLVSPLPNTLVNGTPNDASQVMADFNGIVNNINARLNVATGAGYVGVTSDSRWGGGTSIQDALGSLIDKQQLADTGAVNALVVTPAGSLFTANVSGMFFLVVPGHTTTSVTPTLKIGTAPAFTITNVDGTAHIPGSIVSGRAALFWVDTVNSIAALLNPIFGIGVGAGQTYWSDTGSVNAVAIALPISAYGNGQSFLFKIANTTTNGTPTININGKGSVNFYCTDGTTQPVAGSMIANNIYRGTFNQSLNSGSGGVVVETLSRATSSFTLTLTGMSGTTTGTINDIITSDSRFAIIYVANNIDGVSNATTMTGTGVPANLSSTVISAVNATVILDDNGAALAGSVNGLNSTTWTFCKNQLGSPGGFTASGGKGLQISTWSYPL